MHEILIRISLTVPEDGEKQKGPLLMRIAGNKKTLNVSNVINTSFSFSTEDIGQKKAYFILYILGFTCPNTFPESSRIFIFYVRYPLYISETTSYIVKPPYSIFSSSILSS